MKRIGRVIFILGLLGAAPCFADETDPLAPGGPVAVDETHPIYSADAGWVDSVLIAVGGLFLAAVIVGRIVRAEAMEVVPAAISHVEDPAVDRIHGEPKTN